MMLQLVFYFMLSIVLIYCLLLLRWNFAWNKKWQPEEITIPGPTLKISVIIAARNEAANILNCLHSLKKQSYANFEVIISDDFCEDDTYLIISDFIGKQPELKSWRVITPSPGDIPGKKAALERAITNATGELLLLTDADCTMDSGWVTSFASFYRATGADMITGFVRIQPGAGIFEKLQALEFLSLSGIGAASVMSRQPLMCNGANLAFTKQAYLEAGGYTYGKILPSGDDTFLMLEVARIRKNNIVFNKDIRAVVTTSPVSTLAQLFSQRKRWASKVKYYRESYIHITGVLLFVANMILLLSVLLVICGIFIWEQAAILWILKAVADLVFLFSVSTFARQQYLLLLFLPALFLYPLYALAGLLASPGKLKYSWKGRSYTISAKGND